MKVKCIDDKFSYCGLVVGQEYHAVYLNDEKKDVVINNVCLPLSLFEVIEEEKIFSVEVVKTGFTDLVVGDRYFASKFDDETYSISRFKDMRISIPVSIDYFKVISEEPNAKIGLDVLDISQVGGNHYNKNDPIQFARDNYPREQLEGFFRINIDKYVARYDRKNGVEDLRKAQHYLTLLIDLIDNDKNNG